MNKEKIFKILTLVFFVLTMIGAIYVFINKGEVNAGYSVVPCVFCVIFSELTRNEKKKK